MNAAVVTRSRVLQAVGVCSAALLLGACGQREAKTTVKREDVAVSTEAGPLPAAGTANRLLNEQSAFLRRHAQDPVDWYPWGEAAFAKARAEQKLILVSIGYASCPWSQKMQEETFTDGKVARFMNRHYVNILVDREERPDVNNSYLHFLFWKNKQSGWPLHMWLTPEGLPVFSGVYFPPNPEGGSASWSLTMEHVANRFSSDPVYVKKQAELVAREYLKEYRKFWKDSGTPLTPAALGQAFDKLRAVYDPVNGGFSGAPKFPQPQALDYLMAYSARIGQDRMGRSMEAKQMLGATLDAILAGGIYDQLGGGIHRYSNDVYWAVPQFEKMLYDQGFFAETLILAAQSLGKAEYADAARAVLKYADTDLGHPEGGFYCAEGSSSLGAVNASGLTEGAYYVWTLADIESAVGPESMPLMKLAYGLDERGNIPIDSPSRSRFPGLNVLKMERPFAEVVKLSGKSAGDVTQALAKAKEKLLTARQKRTRPLLDDKVLASWNGTVIAALAQAGWVFDDAPLRDRAVRAMDFVLKRLRREDGSLVHAFLDGPSAAPGYSEDYAMIIRALLEMYANSGEARWLTTAAELQDKQIDQLWDKADGGFFDGPAHPLLFNRMKSVDESTEFSPTSVSTLNLIRLSHLLGRPDYLDKAKQVTATYGSLMMKSSAGFLRMLQAYADLETPPLQVVVVGAANAPDRAEMLAPLRKMLPFGRVILYLDGGAGQAALAQKNPALAKLTAAPGATTTVILCRNFAPLHPPITKPADLTPALEKAMAPATP